MAAMLAGATATSQKFAGSADRLLRRNNANRAGQSVPFSNETMPAFFGAAQLPGEATNPHQVRQFRGHWFRRNGGNSSLAN